MLLEFENQEFWTSLTPSEPLTRLYTPNGRQLYIDLASGHVRHGDKGATDPEVFFLGAPAQSDDRSQGWLVYVDKGALQPITRLEDGVCGASFQQETGSWVAPTLLQAVPLERGLAAFRGEGLFLCADGNGSVTLSRSVCSAWEVFLPEFNLFADFDGAKRLHFDQQIERAAIAKVLIDPSVRARVWGASEKKKIVFFGPTQWSNGRVYCDLCKHLHEYGYIADLLNYREGHGHNIDLLLNYYDLFVCGLEDAMHVLVDIYGVPFEKIVGVSHWTFDIQAFIERYGRESFSKLAGYGVVGNTLLWDSLTLGVTRLPKIVPLGVNYDEFYSKPPTGLTTVGTASSLSAKNRYGVEIKRGHLSQEAAREAGLIFKPAGFWSGHYTPIHDMPDYYRSVDAILVPSLTSPVKM